MIIDAFIDIIKNLDYEVTPEEIADALWLLAQIDQQTDSKPLADETRVASQQNLPNAQDLTTASSSTRPTLEGKKRHVAAQHDQATGDLIPQTVDNASASATRIGGIPIKIPAATPLPGALELARALRPLRRRVSSHYSFAIDEQTTAQRTAEEHALVPVFRPERMRWLAVDLVVDLTASMMIWRSTINEFQLLLRRQGAFRDVRVWSLDTEATTEQLPLYAGSGIEFRNALSHSSNELRDPAGRRLILLVSDAVSRGWHSGQVAKVIATWGKTNPVALVQVLPPWLWNRTALGKETATSFSSSIPGVPNAKLRSNTIDEWGDGRRISPLDVPVPVLTLTPEVLAPWAQMLVGRADTTVRGLILDATPRNEQPSSTREISAELRVERFLRLASPTARELALLLASAPITLPVVNLIQATMLPESRQGHVAEVLLGGLLAEVTPMDRVVDPNAIQYEFFEGVRELLMVEAPVHRSIEVIVRVSEYIEKRMRQEREMQALMVIPGASKVGTTTSENKPFARVRATLLRRMGYRALANVLEPAGKPQKEIIHEEVEDINVNNGAVNQSVELPQIGPAHDEPLRQPQLESLIQQDSESIQPVEFKGSLLLMDLLQSYRNHSLLESSSTLKAPVNLKCFNQEKIRQQLSYPTQGIRMIELSGPSGIGKTHILRAICADTRQEHERMGISHAEWESWKTVYVDADHIPLSFEQIILKLTEKLAESFGSPPPTERGLPQLLLRIVRSGRDHVLFVLDSADEIDNEVLARLAGDEGPAGRKMLDSLAFVPNLILRLVIAYRRPRFSQVMLNEFGRKYGIWGVRLLQMDPLSLADVRDMLIERIESTELPIRDHEEFIDRIAEAIFEMSGGHPQAVSVVLWQLEEHEFTVLPSELGALFRPVMLQIVWNDIIRDLSVMEYLLLNVLSIFRRFNVRFVRRLWEIGLLPDNILGKDNPSDLMAWAKWLENQCETTAHIRSLRDMTSWFSVHPVLRHFLPMDLQATTPEHLHRLHATAHKLYDQDLRSHDPAGIRRSMPLSLRPSYMMEALYHYVQEQLVDASNEPEPSAGVEGLMELAQQYVQLYRDVYETEQGGFVPDPFELRKHWEYDVELRRCVEWLPRGSEAIRRLDQLFQ